MNIGALPELLGFLLKTQGTTPQSGQPQPASSFRPGAQYDAKILDTLPNGRNLVQVGNQALDMALPQQAKVGDVLKLTFINAAPRPTFVVNAPPAANTPAVNVSPAAQQVNALVRYVPVTAVLPGSNSGSATLTSPPIVANPAILLAPATTAGQLLTILPGSVLPDLSMGGEAVEGMRPSVGAQSTLVNVHGMATERGTGNNELPIRLQQTVKESGLFYESHLGKWVRGELDLKTIQREPQARLQQTPGTLLDLPDLEGMPEQAARLANRQLNMLEGGPFIWQGQAWPGQMAEWQVQERDAQGADDEAAGQKWHSQLRLTLPRLGQIAADLDVGALGLRIRLRSADPATLAEINKAMPDLVQRMRDADLNLSSITAGLDDGSD